ncbi:MAG: hypothetical protein ACR2IP_07390 [Solirubrobacteraceae bacterium]
MALRATPIIDTTALWEIIATAFVGGAGVVILFGLLLIGASRARAAGERGHAGARAGYLALSTVCGASCVAVVAIGLYATTKKPSAAKAKPGPKAALVAPGRSVTGPHPAAPSRG